MRCALTEHTFAYRNHRAVWEHASPLTAQDILELDAFCRARYIELVPNQNSFGHITAGCAIRNISTLPKTVRAIPTQNGIGGRLHRSG